MAASTIAGALAGMLNAYGPRDAEPYVDVAEMAAGHRMSNPPKMDMFGGDADAWHRCRDGSVLRIVLIGGAFLYAAAHSAAWLRGPCATDAWVIAEQSFAAASGSFNYAWDKARLVDGEPQADADYWIAIYRRAQNAMNDAYHALLALDGQAA